MIYVFIRLLVVWGKNTEEWNAALWGIILLAIVWFGMILIPVFNHSK
jgi:hypothetical protein